MAIVSVLTDADAVAAAAAERVTVLVEAAMTVRRRAHVCLTGGRTPERLYSLLADSRSPWRERIDWTRVRVFWGDERAVPPDHPDSNFGTAHRALLARVPVRAEHIHRMRAELPDLADAAREYDTTVRAYQPFDVLLLGLGEDAHIASIFPGSPLVGQRDGSCAAAVRVDHLNVWRLTLTPEALLSARAIVVLVSGAEKAEAVRAALDLPDSPADVPAHILRGADDRVEWFIDSAAARLRAAPRG